MRTAETTVWSFPGGLHPPQHKDLSNTTPIVAAPLPQRVVLPLHMHIGAPAIPTVKVGDRVLRGQMIASPEGYVSAPVHASISGHVVAIGPRPIPHPSGLEGDCIVIESDGKDEAVAPAEHTDNLETLDPGHLRNLVRQAGIVGLGGAAFPAAVKLNPGPAKDSGMPIDTLIINGAECEPYITCDDRLMRERAEEIVAGIRVILHATGTKRCLIGIEDNKPEAQAAVNAVLERQKAGHIRVVSTPTIYPEGGEKQLVKVLTGKEVPAGGLPSQVGVICQNAGTAVAIYRAVCKGEALTSRVLTVTGRGVNKAQNVEVRIGTPIQELIAFCGGYTDHVKRLIMGGPMMGFALPSDEIPVVKSTNCVLVATANEVNTDVGDAMPCIRCGECATVCPVKLLPQQLYWHSKAQEFDKVQDYNLFDCIECGCCAHVCPSHIPLVQYYRFAKSEIWEQEKDRRKSDGARQRFEFREQRLEAEAAEKAARAAEKKKQLEAAKAGKASAAPSAAAIALAKAKAAAAKKSEANNANAGDATSAGSNEAKSAALAAVAKARAKAATEAADGQTDKASKPSKPKAKKPAMSAAEIAIAKAKAAAKKKAKAEAAANTDSPSADQAPAQAAAQTPAQSAALAAIAKAKAAAASAKPDSTAADTPPTEAPSTAQSAALAAIAKAKAKAATAENHADTTDAEASDANDGTADDAAAKPLSAAQAAIAKAKAASAAAKPSQTSTKAEAPAGLSAAQAAIAKAKAAAKQNQPQQTAGNDSNENDQ